MSQDPITKRPALILVNISPLHNLVQRLIHDDFDLIHEEESAGRAAAGIVISGKNVGTIKSTVKRLHIKFPSIPMVVALAGNSAAHIKGLFNAIVLPKKHDADDIENAVLEFVARINDTKENTKVSRIHHLNMKGTRLTFDADTGNLEFANKRLGLNALQTAIVEALLQKPAAILSLHDLTSSVQRILKREISVSNVSGAINVFRGIFKRYMETEYSFIQTIRRQGYTIRREFLYAPGAEVSGHALEESAANGIMGPISYTAYLASLASQYPQEYFRAGSVICLGTIPIQATTLPPFTPSLPHTFPVASLQLTVSATLANGMNGAAPRPTHPTARIENKVNSQWRITHGDSSKIFSSDLGFFDNGVKLADQEKKLLTAFLSSDNQTLDIQATAVILFPDMDAKKARIRLNNLRNNLGKKLHDLFGFTLFIVNVETDRCELNDGFKIEKILTTGTQPAHKPALAPAG